MMRCILSAKPLLFNVDGCVMIFINDLKYHSFLASRPASGTQPTGTVNNKIIFERLT